MRAPARAVGLALAVLLASSRTPLAAQEPVPAADTVHLRFAWPDGTEARVEYARTIEREEGGPATRMEIEGEYEMHVHGHPSGLLIEHLNPLATRFQSSPALPPTDPRRIANSSLGMLNADWVVSGDGELLGLGDLEPLAAAVADVLAPLGLDEAGLSEAMGQVTNEQQLMANARDLWRAMVGAWADLRIAPGETFSAEGEEANPLIESVVLPYVHEYSLIGTEACDAPGGTCAHLQLLSFPDPRELTRVMSEALAGMGLDRLSFERLVQLTQVVLLTDPETLLPQDLVLEKRVDGILLDGGERKVFRRLDQTRLHFAY